MRICLARYAIWEDGRFDLKMREYAFETTAGKIAAMPGPESVKWDLIDVIRTSTVPY